MREGHAKGDLNHIDLIEDAKFYQDTALNYQNAYEFVHVQQVELQSKYSAQSYLMEEALVAIKAAEAQQCHQDLLYAKHNCQSEIESAVSRAVEQYKVHLSTAQASLQTWDHEHRLAIQKLQDKIQSLEVSLASQVNLPSVGVSQSHNGAGFHSEVFNFIPGTVNKQRGAAWYDSQDQALSFQKQVRFEDGTSSLDLKPHITSGPAPKASTPHRTTSNLNCTFNISQILPCGTHQDVATIAAEVSAATAAQESKEFCCMHEPKITKLKGGYSADVELVFRSWHADILVHIQDRELDNKSAIQLIKDQTQDSAQCKVVFQLDLCIRDIPYQDLLEHLSMAFHGGNDEVNILAEFYSHSQKPREMEEAFADELQLLAHKVISKKPDFCHALNTTLKQQYANQLYDCNSASIMKTLLLQMPKVTFTQFQNELARVLGTTSVPRAAVKWCQFQL